MSNSIHRLEPMARFEHDNGSDRLQDTPRSGRARLFCFVAGVTLAAGLVWTLFQPVVYRASATVLMTAPQAIDESASEADLQNLAIQRTVMLSDDVMTRLSELIRNRHGAELTRGELKALLIPEAVPDTNLMTMAAEGDERQLLSPLVNGWVDVFLEITAADIRKSKTDTELMVQAGMGGLAAELEKARDALEDYREENDILSVERQENEVMARLDGFNRALSTAIEEEVKAKANLETLTAAVERGENLIPREQRRDVTSLESELQTLRAQYAEMKKQYTKDYINKQPQFRAVPVRIAELEAELAEIYNEGRQAELGSAEQVYAAARQTVVDLQQKLDDHKAEVARFNRIYATHQALAEDLARLEELYREAQARLVQVQVSGVEKFPQVSVINRPGAVPERIGPDYPLLLGGTLLAALGLGIFAVWLQGFLSPKPQQAPHVTLAGVHLYPQEVNGQIAYSSEPEKRLSGGETALLEEKADPDGSESGHRGKEQE